MTSFRHADFTPQPISARPRVRRVPLQFRPYMLSLLLLGACLAILPSVHGLTDSELDDVLAVDTHFDNQEAVDSHFDSQEAVDPHSDGQNTSAGNNTDLSFRSRIGIAGNALANYDDDELTEHVLVKLEQLTSNSSSLTLDEFAEAVVWIDYMLDTKAVDHTRRVANRLLSVMESIFSLTPFDDSIHITSRSCVAMAHEYANLTAAYSGATMLAFETSGTKNLTNKRLAGIRVLDATVPDLNLLNYHSLAAISLPSDILQHTAAYGQRMNKAKIAIKFTAYPTVLGFKSNILDGVMRNISFTAPMIGSKLGSQPIYNLEEPVSIVLRAEVVPGYTPTCAFWDLNGNGGNGSWSTEGCWLANSTSDGQHVCKCNHLTTFSLLMVLRGDAPHLSQTMKIVTISSLGVSAFCLLLTLAIILYFGELRGDLGHKLLCHFSVVLLVVQVISIAMLTAKPGVLVCSTLSLLLFYFMLSLFAWTLSQAIYLYRRLVLVFSKEISSYHYKSVVLCYGIPGLILVVSLASSTFSLSNFQMDKLETANICQLPLNRTIIIGLFSPMGLVLLINLVLFTRIMVTAMKKTASWTDSVHRVSRGLRFFRVAFATFILLGLSWLTGLVAIAAKEFVVDCFFSILLSLTGLFVFISKVVLSERVSQVLWRQAVKDALQEKPSIVQRLSLFSLDSTIPVTSRRISLSVNFSSPMLSPPQFMAPSRSRFSELNVISSYSSPQLGQSLGHTNHLPCLDVEAETVNVCAGGRHVPALNVESGTTVDTTICVSAGQTVMPGTCMSSPCVSIKILDSKSPIGSILETMPTTAGVDGLNSPAVSLTNIDLKSSALSEPMTLPSQCTGTSTSSSTKHIGLKSPTLCDSPRLATGCMSSPVVPFKEREFKYPVLSSSVTLPADYMTSPAVLLKHPEPKSF